MLKMFSLIKFAESHLNESHFQKLGAMIDAFGSHQTVSEVPSIRTSMTGI